MKILITKQKDNLNKTIKIINQQILSKETDNITHELIEVEELEQKQGYTVKYEYDKEKDKIIGKYIEIPKTKEELLLEEITKIKKSIAENIINTSDENDPDLSELDGLV